MEEEKKLYEPHEPVAAALERQQWGTVLSALQEMESAFLARAINFTYNPTGCEAFKKAAAECQAYAEKLATIREALEKELGES